LATGQAYAATSISGLSVSPGSVDPGDNIFLNVQIQTTSCCLSGSATIAVVNPSGIVIDERTFSGFLDQTDIVDGVASETIGPYPVPANTPPGEYTVRATISGSESEGGSVQDTAATTFVVVGPPVPEPPVEFDPPSLSLSGQPGEEVSGSFTIADGSGPFTLSASQGEVSPGSAGVGEPLTYTYTIPAAAVPGSELNDAITAVPASGEPATLPVTILVVEPGPTPVVVEPDSLSLQGVAGETVEQSFRVVAGSAPFALSATQGALSATSVGLEETVTYSYSIPADAEPGTFDASIRVTPASGLPVTVPVAIKVSERPSQPVVVDPSSLSLAGKAGESPTATFAVIAGTPPFALFSSDARGSFDNANPGLNETVTYSFSIPADADAGTELGDTITVTGSDGATTTFVATVTVSESEQPPSQAEIDEAMQSIAVTQPQKSTAAVISTVCPKGVAGEQLQEDCNVLVEGSFNAQDQASRALAEVTADQASAPVDASQTSLQGQIRNIGTRIAALRGGITGFSARGLTLNLDGEPLPVGQIAGGVVGALTGGAAGDGALDLGPWGFFLNGSISSGDKDRTENAAGFDFDAWSVTLGADYRFQDNLIGGIALGYVKNETDIDANGGDLDTEGFNVSLYGTYYLDSGLYLDGILTYGWSDYDQSRRIRYDIGSVIVDQTADADFDGSDWSASLGGGYSMASGPLSFGPTFRLEYLDTSVDGYQESMSNPNAPGGGWATRIEDQDVTSFTSQLGGEISYAVSTSWGVLLPNAHLQWVHEFEDGADNVVGHFVQDPTRTPFSLAADRPDRDYYNLRLGLSAQFAEGRSGYIYYRKLFGYSDLDAYTVAAGLRLEF
jgi:outer membrane autotransporter protein